VVPDASKPLPVEPLTFLAAAAQGIFPGLGHFIPKGVHSIHIAQHSKVVLMTDNHRPKPTANIGDRLMHPPLYLFTDIATLRCYSRSDQAKPLIFNKKHVKYRRFSALADTFQGQKDGCKKFGFS
jgi:hypothetical protein